MTLSQDPPPQTRRQARELERAAAARKAEEGSRSRRAGTTTPTTAGDIPTVSTRPASSSAGTDTSSSLGTDTPNRDAPDVSHPEPVIAPSEPVTPTPMTASAERAEDAGQRPPMTRRELREMLRAEAAAGETPPQPTASVASGEGVEPGPTSEDTATGASELETVVAEVVADDTIAEDAEPAGPVRVVPTQSEVPHKVAAQPFTDILTPHTLAEPAQDEPESHEAAAGVSVAETTDSGSHRAFIAPAAHWSVAAAEEDDGVDDPVNDTGGYARSRVASGSATTANALILPSIPSLADATGPLTSTGEILVTGSIDLPRSLGSTGTHSGFDSADIDSLLDNPEAAQSVSDAAPVRASRAISSHTSTRDVITPRRRGSGTKLPIVLAVTAAVLALGVIGLLVAGYVFHAF